MYQIWSQGVHCGKFWYPGPLGVPISGHHFSRLALPSTQQDQTKAVSYYMKKGYERVVTMAASVVFNLQLKWEGWKLSSALSSRLSPLSKGGKAGLSWTLSLKRLSYRQHWHGMDQSLAIQESWVTFVPIQVRHFICACNGWSYVDYLPMASPVCS